MLTWFLRHERDARRNTQRTTTFNFLTTGGDSNQLLSPGSVYLVGLPTWLGHFIITLLCTPVWLMLKCLALGEQQHSFASCMGSKVPVRNDAKRSVKMFQHHYQYALGMVGKCAEEMTLRLIFSTSISHVQEKWNCGNLDFGALRLRKGWRICLV